MLNYSIFKNNLCLIELQSLSLQCQKGATAQPPKQAATFLGLKKVL
jgi:hypothetical protein